MDKIEATLDEVIAAFTEWERRYREEPSAFQSEYAKFSQPESAYGAAAGPYFASLLNQLRGGGAQP